MEQLIVGLGLYIFAMILIGTIACRNWNKGLKEDEEEKKRKSRKILQKLLTK